VSWQVAHDAYTAHVEAALAAPLPRVCVLGIDETRRGKIRWVQDPATGRWTVAHDRWHTAVVDAAGSGGLLAHIDGRTAAKVTEWLRAQPDSWRAGITHVTIDLSASFLRAVTDALPGAVVVADRFHLVQLANQMLTDVRQRATRDVRGRRGRKKDPEWAARRRLLTGYERLGSDRFARLWNALVDVGDPGVEILHAYTVKENLRLLLALAGTHPDREVISHRLWRFYDQAASSTSPEVHRLAATIETWWPAVEAAITTGYSNARSEGLQPTRQTPRTQRLRLQKRRQPPPTHTVGLHSSTPTSHSQDHPDARPSLKSQYAGQLDQPECLPADRGIQHGPDQGVETRVERPYEDGCA